MPRNESHVMAGSTAGALYSLFLSKDQKAEDRFLELIGGGIGGYWGGRLPDIVEPAPRNPGHRAFAHSLVVGSASYASAKRFASEWARCFRQAADRLALQNQEQPSSEPDRLLCVALEILLRVAAGMGAGFIAGYVSHLVLDAGTPRSLPLA